MDLKFSLNDIYNIVPVFDGNPAELNKFIACGNILFSSAKTEAEHTFILEVVKTRLEGSAFELIQFKSFTKWNDLVRDLEKEFKEEQSRTSAQNDLLTARQRMQESVKEYGERVGKLLHSLNSATFASISDEAVRAYLKIENDRLAIQVFEDGLRNQNLRLILKAHNEQNLKKAIAYAVEHSVRLEKTPQFVSSLQKSTCSYCKRIGHTQETCYRKNSASNPNNTANSRPQNIQHFPNIKKEVQSIFCTFCKRPNHTYQECRSRQRSAGNFQNRRINDGSNAHFNPFKDQYSYPNPTHHANNSSGNVIAREETSGTSPRMQLIGMGKDHEFLEAAHCGNIAFIEKALNQKAKRNGPLASLRRGPDVNVQDSLGYSALHHASLTGHSDIVSTLLAYKASPNLADARGSSPLHLAAWAGHTEIVKMLLIHQYKPVNPNMQTVENETPLHCAAHQGHIGAISALLAHKADPNLRNNRNETPLDLAAQYGHLQAVKMLIHAHPELILQQPCATQTLQLPKHTCLHLASRNGHNNVVDVLLAAGINVDLRTPAGSALHEAALCGKEPVVRTLLQAGIDLNATDSDGRTALDILKEFPPHVTKGIVSVINNFSNHIDASSRKQRNKDVALLKQQESIKNENHANRSTRLPNNHLYHFNSNNHLLNYAQADLAEQSIKIHNSKTSTNKNRIYNCENSFDQGVLQTPASAYELKWYNGRNLEATKQSQINSQNDNTLITSTSMSSFEPTFVNPPSHISAGGISLAVRNNINAATSASAPPKKPPRRNTSVSPTHNQNNPQRNHHRSSSIESYSHPKYHDTHDIDYCNQNFQKNNNAYNQRNQFTKDFIELNARTYNQVLHSPLIAIQQEKPSLKAATDLFKPVLKSYNLNRKLKRNRDSCSLSDKLCQSLSSNNSKSSETTATNHPQSPTNYLQPPTPDHPPPSVNQAERMIHERITPLSMEYKRRHNKESESNTQSDIFKALPRPVSLPSASPMDNTQNISRTEPVFVLGSSGSLNTGISCSDSCMTTNYLDEYGSDMPSVGPKSVLLEDSNNDIVHQRQQGTHMQSVKLKISLDQAQQNNMNNDISIYNDSCEDSQPPDNTNRQERIKLFLGKRVDQVSLPETTPTHSIENSILSPFNEEEAWERISEIIESFGSGILNDDLLIRSSDSNSFLFDFDDNEMTTERHELATRLKDAGLLQLERILFENGYDNYKFVNGVLNERDIQAMSICTVDVPKLLEFIKTLPVALFPSHMMISTNIAARSNQSPSSAIERFSSISYWLSRIELSNYTECFSKHLYNSIESVYGVWDVELQTVLEINKLGHRRRILQSLCYMQETQQSESKVPSSERIEDNHILSSRSDNVVLQKPFERIQKNGSVHLRRKNRPAPPPPTTKNVESLKIRAPSELLLGLPSNMSTKWRHSTLELVNEQLKYEVCYLGSTIVKELCGTESAHKSIQKLKRDDIPPIKSVPAPATEKMLFVNKINKLLQIQPGKSLPKFSNNNQLTSSAESILNENQQDLPLMVCLAISQRGVEFIDVTSKSSICEHQIQNINCACQDAIDLSYFAYITKEQDIHYCHVFHVDRMDLATEIILTLGQAFEVAYQLTLRKNGATEKPSEQME